MINHVLISFFAVQLYDISYIYLHLIYAKIYSFMQMFCELFFRLRSQCWNTVCHQPTLYYVLVMVFEVDATSILPVL